MLCPSIGTGRTVSHEISRITHSLPQGVKNLPARQETQVWSLSQGGPLEKGMATHSSILAWRIPWTKECGQLQSMGPQRVGHDWVVNTHVHFWRKIILNLAEEYCGDWSRSAKTIIDLDCPSLSPLILRLLVTHLSWGI